MRHLGVLIIAASLAAAPAAFAKEVQAVRVCGATECFTFDRGNAGGKLQLLADTGRAVDAPRRAAGWYELRTRVGGEGMKPVEWTSAYVPSLGLVRIDDEGGGGYEWHAVYGEIAPVLRTVAGRLEPRPAASLRVNDMAPGILGPTPTPTPAASPPHRDSGVGGGWWVLAVAAAAALAGGVLVVRRR
jgi:hypothetical protein